jgi:hypothetical protein
MSATMEQQVADSHQLLGSFFSGWVLNRLIHLFDADPTFNDPVHNIVAYIDEEHKLRKIDTTDITVVSRVHGHLRPKPDPMCIAEISYKGVPIVHLTIHVAPNRLLPAQHGMIHLVKNHYQNKSKYGVLSDGARVRLLAIVPKNKPNSLFFRIMDGKAPPSQGNISLDPIIQKEMKVLVAVLNKIFDEKDLKHYVGSFPVPNGQLFNMNTPGIPPIRPPNPKTPLVVSQVNATGIAITRQNKGVPYTIATPHPSLLPSSTASTSIRRPLSHSMKKKRFQRRRTLHKSRKEA